MENNVKVARAITNLLKRYAKRIIAVDIATYNHFLLEEDAASESVLAKAQENITKKDSSLTAFFNSCLKGVVNFTPEEYALLEELVEKGIQENPGVTWESVFAEKEEENYTQHGCWYHMGA